MVETVEESDVVVFMTCCVREAADTRLYGQVASMKNIPLRAESPLSKRVIAVGGCIGQRDGEKLTEALPHLDVVFGTHNLGSLPRLLEAAIEGQGKQVEVLAASSEFPTKLPTSREHYWRRGCPSPSGATISVPTASFPMSAVAKNHVRLRISLRRPSAMSLRREGNHVARAKRELLRP